MLVSRVCIHLACISSIQLKCNCEACDNSCWNARLYCNSFVFCPALCTLGVLNKCCDWFLFCLLCFGGHSFHLQQWFLTRGHVLGGGSRTSRGLVPTPQELALWVPAAISPFPVLSYWVCVCAHECMCVHVSGCMRVQLEMLLMRGCVCEQC